MSQEYVSIPVPVDRVQEVYELLGRPKRSSAGAEQPPTPPEKSDTSTSVDGDVLRRAYRESPETMKKVFEYLAENAGRSVPMEELARAVGREPRQMAGALGAFGRRWKNRYHNRESASWPFSAYWNFEGNSMIYSLPPEAAEVIKKAK